MDNLSKGLSICGGVTLFVIVLVITCWDTVEPIEYGIKYNSISKNVNPDRSIIYIYKVLDNMNM